MMRWRKAEPIPTTPRQRVYLVIFGLLFMVPGVASLVAGSLYYRGYRDLLVFAPFTLLIGLVMIIFALRVGRK
jgi:hypothetical protein